MLRPVKNAWPMVLPLRHAKHKSTPLPNTTTHDRYYPDSAVFELDPSTLFTVVMVIFVLLGTLPVVARSGYHFPAKAPVALLGAYAVYMIGALCLTLTFKAY